LCSAAEKAGGGASDGITGGEPSASALPILALVPAEYSATRRSVRPSYDEAQEGQTGAFAAVT
jgi:hypothetical protein